MIGFRQVALLALSLGFSLLVLECGSFLLSRTSLREMPTPDYSFAPRSSLAPELRFWADLDPHFGVWHSPGSRFRHTQSCFDVEYRANAHGQRDRPREKDSRDDRFVVVGDSMVEGYGVERADRMTDRLEAESGIEFLNFGTSGDFGPTQFHLLYRHLASGFSHDAVLVGLLPANDFRDDDIEFGRRVYADRYRPYWVGTPPDFELTYFRPSLEAGASSDAQRRRYGPRELLRSFSYAYNAAQYGKQLLARRDVDQRSSFYDYPDLGWARLTHSLSLIKQDAGSRPVVLILIPIELDLERRATHGEAPLSRAMRTFAEREGFLLIDLLEAFAARAAPDPGIYYHPCDGHWGPHGHAVAAEEVGRFLVEAGLLGSPDSR